MFSKTKPGSTTALPAETLLEIFHILHERKHPPRRGVSAKFEPPRKTQFPYNIDGVSRSWRSLVRSVFRFWDCIEVFLDNPAAQKDLDTKLYLSEKQPINVCVVRKDYSEDVDDLKEQLIVNSIVKQLAPHIDRCVILYFDVLHSTSIPLVSSFSGASTKLCSLQIRCRRGPASPNIRPNQPPPRLQPFVCSNLRDIDIHGRVFMEAIRIPDFLDRLRHLPGKRLTISDLTREEAGEYDLRAFIKSLASIGHLISLKLRNIDIDVGDCATPVKGLRYINRAPATIHIQNFDFYGLSAEFIQGFFGAYDNKIDVSRLVITNCGIPKVDGLEVWELSLHNLHTSERELIEFLVGWDGFLLELHNVTGGVTDKLFERLSLTDATPGREPSPYDKQRFCMPTLRRLTITSHDPLPLSPEMLKEMVFARKNEAGRYLNVPSTTHFLGLFSVTVIRSVNKISEQDRVLMSGALEEFYWAGPQEEKPLAGDILNNGRIKSQLMDESPLVGECIELPQVKAELDTGEALEIKRSNSPVLDSDCADWDFSRFNDPQVGAPKPVPSVASQTAETLGTMKLEPTEVPSRSPSPFVRDDYADMDWSSLDIGYS